MKTRRLASAVFAAALVAPAAARADEAKELPVRRVPNLGEGAEFYFSPDSRLLIGNAKREGDAAYHVYVTDLLGTHVTRLNDAGEDACSFFFPDGKRVVWTSTRDHLDLPKGAWSDPANYPKGAELYSSDLAGKDVRRLTNNRYYDAEVSVSPDGRFILFGREIDGKMDLWVMNVDGTGERQVTFTDDWQEGGAQFMPDSETILYRAWKRSDQGQRALPMQIFTIKRDGSGTRQITHEEGTNWAPFPAPDGKHFAFVKVLPGESARPNFEIFLMNIEDGKQTRLTYNDRFDGFPAISPDGKLMTFSSGRDAKEGARTLSQYVMDVSSLGIGPKSKKPPPDATLNLPIGARARRDREAKLVLDGILDNATGELVTPSQLAARLGDVALLFVGESHTSVESHNVERRVLEELLKTGRRVLIGLEMYPYPAQPWLDQWSAGGLSEDAFVRDSHWYKAWGYNWLYYRDIFLLAREHRLPTFAVNVPRDVVTSARKKGGKDLSPEEAGHMPARVDTDNAEHRRLFKAFFGPEDSLHSADMTEEQWDGMFRAQCTWDAAMGFSAVEALRRAGGRDAIMVVLIGSGHVAYGLGAERQARLWFDGKTASLVPVEALDERGEPQSVRASYADFVWGVAREAHSAFPSLGLSTPEQKTGERYPVIGVQKGSVADVAGIQIGDLLVSLDGTPLADKETLNALVAQKRWGDTAEIKLQRGAQTLTLTAAFRRLAER